MKEKPVEERLKARLERYGFKVLKLTTPGTNGVPDRMILRPTWSPGAPYFVEIKRPGEKERRLQEIIRDEWRARGLIVLDVCDTYGRVNEIEAQLCAQCERERTDRKELGVYQGPDAYIGQPIRRGYGPSAIKGHSAEAEVMPKPNKGTE
jgi:hypothetical protein